MASAQGGLDIVRPNVELQTCDQRVRCCFRHAQIMELGYGLAEIDCRNLAVQQVQLHPIGAGLV